MQRLLRGGGGFRAYTALLCALYLLVVVLFHASLQPHEPRGISDHSAHHDSANAIKKAEVEEAAEEAQAAVIPPLNHKVLPPEMQKHAPMLKKNDALGFKPDVDSAVAVAPVGGGEMERMNQQGDHVKGPAVAAGKAPQMLAPKAADVVVSPPLPCTGQDMEEQAAFQEVTPDVRIYSVYWDERPNDFDNLSRGYRLRMMAVIQQRAAHMKRAVYCVFGEGDSAVPVQATYYEMCENHNRPYGGYILSCVVPSQINEQPCSIVISQSTDTSNGQRFKVQSTVAREHRRDFAVCVSPLFGNIDPLKLVEWLELTKSLGAQRINLYHQDLHAADSMIKRIVQYYIDSGLVAVMAWPLGDEQEKGMWYHGQLVAVQDCLYRNMATAKYVMFNDLDEFMVPHVHGPGNWSAFVGALDDANTCAFQFHSAFFDPARQNYDTRPEEHAHFLTLSDTKRSRLSSRVRTKCLIKAERVFEAGIHHISKPIYANMQAQRIDLPVAVLHHYRTCMPNFGMDCSVFEDDRTIPQQFASTLTTSVHAALRELRTELLKFTFDSSFKHLLQSL